MRTAKTFDCVQMKDEIQARLAKRRRGMTDAEIRSEIRANLAASENPIAKLWRAIDRPGDRDQD